MAEYPQKPVILHCRYHMLISGGIAGDHYWWPCPALRVEVAFCCSWLSLSLWHIVNLFQRTDRLGRRERERPRGSYDPHIYIDSIRVPRGVPNEFKARNHIVAGFESVLFWWPTVNKNVDWINYIYYN